MVFRQTPVIRFADTDAARVVHFARQLEWVEAIEHAWLRRAGVPVFDAADAGWPRKSLTTSWHRPVRLTSEVAVSIDAFTTGRTSLRYHYSIAPDDPEPPWAYSSGVMTIVRLQDGAPAAVKPEWRETLGELVPWLDPAEFAKVHG